MIRIPLLLLALGLCATSVFAQDSPGDETPTFKSGARVHAQISSQNVDETEWYSGVATTSTEGCGLLVLSGVPSPFVARDGTVLVTFQTLMALELSSLYDGHIDPDTYRQRNYTPEKSLEGETWIPVSVDSLKAADPEACQR